MFFKNWLCCETVGLNDLTFKDEITKRGGKIFAVGGVVRDSMLGKESKDLDIIITGIPFDELGNILKKYGKVNEVGKSFGIIKFNLFDFPDVKDEIDIALPRTEKKVGAGHKGFEVQSDSNLSIEEDLLRRDFTINAMARDIDGNLIDPYHGQEDLKNKIIRIVNPKAFHEDPLRMLRAVQFASRFGFTIEPETMKLIQQNAEQIKEIPSDRILVEIEKIVNKGNILNGVENLVKSGLHQVIFGPKQDFRWQDFNKVKHMGELLYLLLPKGANISKLISNLDLDYLNLVTALQSLENVDNNELQQKIALFRAINIDKRIVDSEIVSPEIRRYVPKFKSGEYPSHAQKLAVSGGELMAMGLKGKAIGDKQKEILLMILDDKLHNNKEKILNYLKGESK